MIPEADTRPSLSEPARRSMSSQCGSIFLQAEVVRRNRVEQAVIGLCVKPPEARTTDIGRASGASGSATTGRNGPGTTSAIRAGIGHDLQLS